MKAVKGVTLLELVVASALTGLLFLSGLQMLSAMFSVHAAVMKPTAQGASWEQVRLQAWLRNTLQDATDLEIVRDGKAVRYRQTTELAFKQDPTCGKWLLIRREEDQEPQVLFQWKALGKQRFAFAWQDGVTGLLDIYMGQNRPSLTLWLRNQS